MFSSHDLELQKQRNIKIFRIQIIEDEALQMHLCKNPKHSVILAHEGVLAHDLAHIGNRDVLFWQ